MDSLSALSNIASPDQQIGIAMLGKAMDAQSTEVAQLLQGLPAPMPAHLGGHVNMLA